MATDSTSTYDEKELLSRIAEGDETAFSLFFHHYQHRVMQIAFYFTKSEAHSKDVVQDVFVKIWNTRSRLSEIAYPDAWVATIARNFTVSALRKIARQELRSEQYADHLPSVELNDTSQLDYRDVEAYVKEALGALHDQQRRVFEMAKLEGLGREVIAEQLGISPNTVKVHLLRATRYVRAYLLEKLDYLTYLMITLFLF